MQVSTLTAELETTRAENEILAKKAGELEEKNTELTEREEEARKRAEKLDELHKEVCVDSLSGFTVFTALLVYCCQHF